MGIVQTYKEGRCRDCKHCIAYDHRHKTWVKCANDPPPDIRQHYQVDEPQKPNCFSVGSAHCVGSEISEAQCDYAKNRLDDMFCTCEVVKKG